MVTFAVPDTSSDESSDPSPRGKTVTFAVPESCSGDSSDSSPRGTPGTFAMPDASPDESDDLGTPDRASTPVAATRKRGRDERSTPKDAALIMLNERPGKIPRFCLRSPGFASDDDVFRWREDVGEDNDGQRVNREVARDREGSPDLQDVERKALLLNHDNVVQLVQHHGFEGDDEEAARRLVWRFDDAGTLHRAILSRKRPAGLPTSRKFQGLPESLVWHTLISLLKATMYLHTGVGVDGYQDRDHIPGWKSIVHNSINPANIFFSHPVKREGFKTPTYGRCRIGNFSRCITLPLNPEVFDDDQTRQDRKTAFQGIRDAGEQTGYEAPEMITDGIDTPGPWSDLWSIGAVMIAMMTGSHIWDFVLELRFVSHLSRGWRQSTIPENWTEVSLTSRRALLLTVAGNASLANALPDRYSGQLRMIVEALLMLGPEDRGQARDVLFHAEAYLEANKDELGYVGENEEGSDDDDANDHRAILRRAAEVRKRSREDERRARELMDDWEA